MPKIYHYKNYTYEAMIYMIMEWMHFLDIWHPVTHYWSNWSGRVHVVEIVRGSRYDVT
jgi:hypothetical protein